MAPCVTYKTSIRSVSCVIKFSTPWPDKLILLSEIPDNSDKIQSSGLSLTRMSRFWTIEFSVDFRQAGLIDPSLWGDCSTSCVLRAKYLKGKEITIGTFLKILSVSKIVIIFNSFLSNPSLTPRGWNSTKTTSNRLTSQVELIVAHLSRQQGHANVSPARLFTANLQEPVFLLGQQWSMRH